jgi:hypothetical protein
LSEAAIGVAIRSCPGVQPRRSYSRLHAIVADSASFANSADRFANNFASDIGWLNRSRRLSKDFEALPETTETVDPNRHDPINDQTACSQNVTFQTGSEGFRTFPPVAPKAHAEVEGPFGAVLQAPKVLHCSDDAVINLAIRLISLSGVHQLSRRFANLLQDLTSPHGLRCNGLF